LTAAGVLQDAPTRRTDVVLVRHGRTAWNAQGRFQGHADPPLDAAGRAQAEALAVALAPLAPARIASSDLRRARQTAAPLARRCDLPVTVDRRLREVDVGRWAGLTPAEVEVLEPAEWAAWSAGVDVARGGGETAAEAGRRVAATLLELVGVGHGEGPLVVISHGLALRGALDELRSRDLVDLPDGPVAHLRNAQWLVVSVGPG
jgi:glucosyl-3-phosphoglycerate phosphatase